MPKINKKTYPVPGFRKWVLKNEKLPKNLRITKLIDNVDLPDGNTSSRGYYIKRRGIRYWFSNPVAVIVIGNNSHSFHIPNSEWMADIQGVVEQHEKLLTVGYQHDIYYWED